MLTAAQKDDFRALQENIIAAEAAITRSHRPNVPALAGVVDQVFALLQEHGKDQDVATLYVRARLAYGMYLLKRDGNHSQAAAALNVNIYRDAKVELPIPKPNSYEYKLWKAYLLLNRGILLYSCKDPDAPPTIVAAENYLQILLNYHSVQVADESGLLHWHGVAQVYRALQTYRDESTYNPTPMATQTLTNLDNPFNPRLYMVATGLFRNLPPHMWPKVPGSGWFNTRLFARRATVRPAQDLYWYRDRRYY